MSPSGCGHPLAHPPSPLSGTSATIGPSVTSQGTELVHLPDRGPHERGIDPQPLATCKDSKGDWIEGARAQAAPLQRQV